MSDYEDDFDSQSKGSSASSPSKSSSSSRSSRSSASQSSRSSSNSSSSAPQSAKKEDVQYPPQRTRVNRKAPVAINPREEMQTLSPAYSARASTAVSQSSAAISSSSSSSSSTPASTPQTTPPTSARTGNSAGALLSISPDLRPSPERLSSRGKSDHSTLSAAYGTGQQKRGKRQPSASLQKKREASAAKQAAERKSPADEEPDDEERAGLNSRVADLKRQIEELDSRIAGREHDMDGRQRRARSNRASTIVELRKWQTYLERLQKENSFLEQERQSYSYNGPVNVAILIKREQERLNRAKLQLRELRQTKQKLLSRDKRAAHTIEEVHRRMPGRDEMSQRQVNENLYTLHNLDKRVRELKEEIARTEKSRHLMKSRSKRLEKQRREKNISKILPKDYDALCATTEQNEEEIKRLRSAIAVYMHAASEERNASATDDPRASPSARRRMLEDDVERLREKIRQRDAQIASNSAFAVKHGGTSTPGRKTGSALSSPRSLVSNTDPRPKQDGTSSSSFLPAIASNSPAPTSAKSSPRAVAKKSVTLSPPLAAKTKAPAHVVEPPQPQPKRSIASPNKPPPAPEVLSAEPYEDDFAEEPVESGVSTPVNKMETLKQPSKRYSSQPSSAGSGAQQGQLSGVQERSGNSTPEWL